MSMRDLNKIKAKYGPWALVTGATSGIGREMARQLALGDFSLVVAGRKATSLEELTSTLKADGANQVIPVAGDLSREKDVEALLRVCDELPIGIAILNAGFGTSGKFVDAMLSEELNMLRVNCQAIFQMSHQFVGQFRSDSRRGTIVLLSSIVAFQGVPNAAHYAATKAYVQSLGEALAVELKAENIDVLTAAPGPVASGFAARAGMKMGSAMSPAMVAKAIIRSIGRQKTILPGYLSKLLAYSLSVAPRWMKIRIMGAVMEGFTRKEKT